MDLLSQEINTHLKFDNENIAKLVTYGFSGKLKKSNKSKTIKYLILELGERGAMMELLQTQKRLPVKMARFFFRQIVNGLAVLHQNNIAHRDIKLENFILTKEYNLKLIDFGFSCEINNSNKEPILYTKILGSESYMSPEMLFERKYFADKSDIYSLGVVLFCMLVGQLPFMRAARYDSIYASFAFKREVGIKKFWENVNKMVELPNDAIDLMNKMFCANPNDRVSLDNIIKSEFYNGDTDKAEDLYLFFNSF